MTKALDASNKNASFFLRAPLGVLSTLIKQLSVNCCFCLNLLKTIKNSVSCILTISHSDKDYYIQTLDTPKDLNN